MYSTYIWWVIVSIISINNIIILPFLIGSKYSGSNPWEFRLAICFARPIAYWITSIEMGTWQISRKKQYFFKNKIKIQKFYFFCEINVTWSTRLDYSSSFPTVGKFSTIIGHWPQTRISTWTKIFVISIHEISITTIWNRFGFGRRRSKIGIFAAHFLPAIAFFGPWSKFVWRWWRFRSQIEQNCYIVSVSVSILNSISSLSFINSSINTLMFGNTNISWKKFFWICYAFFPFWWNS